MVRSTNLRERRKVKREREREKLMEKGVIKRGKEGSLLDQAAIPL